ncbi:hypothetical protein CXB49_21045 [Chromobacterium sp. ATCC 53434]|uniref:hypothetical protein n=1 Tax=Chromobacterium sp. (strain ATCC 53434 / SC 14030) TaxID=2059672 RepID=UPI000C773DE9|nr:hypothetical protein [Chromobacterium sp. ATCC 53434]AUH53100.1 hypothetical protein CXB49_21045 [Chromobacterium sp. ATCC 53434]
MRTILIPLCASFAIAGCDQQQTTQLQQAASAAIGNVHKSVETASAPLGQLQQQASDALGAAKQIGSATLNNPEVKQQVDKLKEQASALKSAIKPQDEKR